MRPITLLLSILILWLCQSCSPLGEPVDEEKSDNFYFNKAKTDIIYSRMGNWFELGKSPLNADASGFKVLNKHIGKDKKRAYYRQHAIAFEGLDLESFHASTEDWMWHIGLDKHHVYALKEAIVDGKWKLILEIIEQADPVTYQQYDFYWSKDDNRHFYDHKVISVDYNSFEIINDTFAKDSAHIYFHYQGQFDEVDGNARSFKKIDKYHAMDTAYVYFFLDYLNGEKIGKIKKAPFHDAQTIKVTEQYYLQVDNLMFYKGIPLKGVKASKFTVLDEVHGKDDEHVYYQDHVIPEADVATFRYDKKEYVYRDKNHRYRGGEILKED